LCNFEDEIIAGQSEVNGSQKKSKNPGLNRNRQYQNKDNTLISKDKREKVHLPFSPQQTRLT